jgi:hypothetical protein
VIDVLHAVLKSLILFNLAGIEASTVEKLPACEAAEVATVGVASVLTTDVVVAYVTEFLVGVMVLVPGPGLEAVDLPAEEPTPILSAQVDTLEAVVLVGTFACDIASDTAVAVEAVEAVGVVVMGTIGMDF